MSGHALGLDVGGANLKLGHSAGKARLEPFALWRNPGGLAGQLRRLIDGAPPWERLAVTMTGELCDCYRSRREGVLAILEAAAQLAGPRPVRVWTNQGNFVDLATARQHPLRVASANWLALATFVGRYAPDGPALLLDIGSTTTDIVPLLNGRPVPNGRTDSERLDCGELVYLGWKRTPLCALVGGRGHAAEFFATLHDAYLAAGCFPEDPADRDTADGQPATREAALRRIARLRCSDLETLGEAECVALAGRMNALFLGHVILALNHVTGQLPGRPQALVFAGSGEFLHPMIRKHPQLVEPLRACSKMSVCETLGDMAGSAAGCALAVAVLAAEEAV